MDHPAPANFLQHQHREKVVSIQGQREFSKTRKIRMFTKVHLTSSWGYLALSNALWVLSSLPSGFIHKFTDMASAQWSWENPERPQTVWVFLHSLPDCNLLVTANGTWKDLTASVFSFMERRSPLLSNKKDHSCLQKHRGLVSASFFPAGPYF